MGPAAEQLRDVPLVEVCETVGHFLSIHDELLSGVHVEFQAALLQHTRHTAIRPDTEERRDEVDVLLAFTSSQHLRLNLARLGLRDEYPHVVLGRGQGVVDTRGNLVNLLLRQLRAATLVARSNQLDDAFATDGCLNGIPLVPVHHARQEGRVCFQFGSHLQRVVLSELHATGFSPRHDVLQALNLVCLNLGNFRRHITRRLGPLRVFRELLGIRNLVGKVLAVSQDLLTVNEARLLASGLCIPVIEVALEGFLSTTQVVRLRCLVELVGGHFGRYLAHTRQHTRRQCHANTHRGLRLVRRQTNIVRLGLTQPVRQLRLIDLAIDLDVQVLIAVLRLLLQLAHRLVQVERHGLGQRGAVLSECLGILEDLGQDLRVNLAALDERREDRGFHLQDQLSVTHGKARGVLNLMPVSTTLEHPLGFVPVRNERIAHQALGCRHTTQRLATQHQVRTFVVSGQRRCCMRALEILLHGVVRHFAILADELRELLRVNSGPDTTMRLDVARLALDEIVANLIQALVPLGATLHGVHLVELLRGLLETLLRVAERFLHHLQAETVCLIPDVSGVQLQELIVEHPTNVLEVCPHFRRNDLIEALHQLPTICQVRLAGIPDTHLGGKVSLELRVIQDGVLLHGHSALHLVALERCLEGQVLRITDGILRSPGTQGFRQLETLVPVTGTLTQRRAVDNLEAPILDTGDFLDIRLTGNRQGLLDFLDTGRRGHVVEIHRRTVTRPDRVLLQTFNRALQCFLRHLHVSTLNGVGDFRRVNLQELTVPLDLGEVNLLVQIGLGVQARRCVRQCVVLEVLGELLEVCRIELLSQLLGLVNPVSHDALLLQERTGLGACQKQGTLTHDGRNTRRRHNPTRRGFGVVRHREEERSTHRRVTQHDVGRRKAALLLLGHRLIQLLARGLQLVGVVRELLGKRLECLGHFFRRRRSHLLNLRQIGRQLVRRFLHDLGSLLVNQMVHTRDTNLSASDLGVHRQPIVENLNVCRRACSHRLRSRLQDLHRRQVGRTFVLGARKAHLVVAGKSVGTRFVERLTARHFGSHCLLNFQDRRRFQLGAGHLCDVLQGSRCARVGRFHFLQTTVDGFTGYHLVHFLNGLLDHLLTGFLGECLRGHLGLCLNRFHGFLGADVGLHLLNAVLVFGRVNFIPPTGDIHLLAFSGVTHLRHQRVVDEIVCHRLNRVRVSIRERFLDHVQGAIEKLFVARLRAKHSEGTVNRAGKLHGNLVVTILHAQRLGVKVRMRCINLVKVRQRGYLSGLSCFRSHCIRLLGHRLHGRNRGIRGRAGSHGSRTDRGHVCGCRLDGREVLVILGRLRSMRASAGRSGLLEQVVQGHLHAFGLLDSLIGVPKDVIHHRLGHRTHSGIDLLGDIRNHVVSLLGCSHSRCLSGLLDCFTQGLAHHFVCLLGGSLGGIHHFIHHTLAAVDETLGDVLCRTRGSHGA